ncbi:MAG: AAA family ATPase [Candidatus Riflebacteria bacterium]|nr:AAA family ATPase [Candidatus Riflebacteria bacterium]
MNSSKNRKIYDPETEEAKQDVDELPHDFLDPEKSTINGLLDNKPPDRKYLIKNLLTKDPLITIAAPGGMGKGYCALQTAVSMATQIPLFKNPNFTVPKAGNVVFLSLEDDRHVVRERLWAIYHNVTATMTDDEKADIKAKMEKRIIIPPSAGKMFPLFPDKSRKNMKALIKFITEIGNVKLLILDPANLLLHEDLSKNDMVSRFTQKLQEVSKETKATIMLLTHTNKFAMRDSQSGGDSTGVLGAVSLVNTSRVVYTMRSPGDAYLKEYELFEEPENYVILHNAKGNYVPRGMGNVLLKRADGGVLEYIALKPDDPMKHPNGIASLVQKQPGIGKTELLRMYCEQAGTARRDAEKAIYSAEKGKLIVIGPEKKNNRISYFPPSDAVEEEEL